MSRSFSVLLIALGIAILGSLVYLHFYLMERQHQVTFTEASHISQAAIRQKMDKMEADIHQLKRYMEEYGIKHRRPILGLVERASAEREELFQELFPRGTNPSGNYLDEKRWIRPISDYRELSTTALNKLKHDCQKLFENHYNDLDLREEDARKKGQKLVAKIEYSLPFAQDVPEDFSRALLMLNFLNQQDAILTEILPLAGNKALIIDQYFPIMTLGPEQPIAGEKVTARLMAGAFSGKLDNSEIVLIVGNDTLTAGPDGTVDYTFEAGRQGLHTLRTKCIVTTPLTGNVITGEGKYTYRSY